MKIVHKLFNTKASSIDEATKSVSFTISTDDVDRYGDVVDQKSWNFESYEANPVLLWGHDPSEPENVLGVGSNLKVAPDGKSTSATLTFATDINAKAALVWDLIRRGVLRTVSVGFRNHSLEYDEDTPVLKDNELLEISVVPIPANAGALAKELKAGQLHEKDAKWLVDGMRRETDLLEAQIKSTKKEKSMTEEQATKLIDSVADLKATVEAQNAKLEEQAATIAELKEAQPAAETDEEKAAREAKEAEEAEAARQAEEDAKDNPAKPGDDDQGGAGGDSDDFDEDAELTPEQEAEAREALELPAAA